jgi:type II secretory pathway pseudopilin PulG
MKSHEKGFQLAELIVSLAVLVLILLLGAPSLVQATSDMRLRLAAYELVGVLRLARSSAVQLDANVAVKFRTAKDGTVTFTLYRDGDGDGVLNKDIDAGVDRPLGSPRRLANLGRGVGFGFPPGPAPADPGSPGHPLDVSDPIRFNSSDLASFSSLGTSTPGSLYLTDGVGRLMAVRVANRQGKVRVLTWFPERRIWRD